MGPASRTSEELAKIGATEEVQVARRSGHWGRGIQPEACPRLPGRGLIRIQNRGRRVEGGL